MVALEFAGWVIGMRGGGDWGDGRTFDGPEAEDGGPGIPVTAEESGTGGGDAARARIAALEAEIGALRDELERAARRIADLESQAREDDLTGLLNRRGLYAEFARILGFGRRYGFPSALVYVDLDSFKAINDRHGHAVGDEVLIAVARRIRDQVRDSDVVGRLGGDEFVIVLRQTDLATARAKAEAVRAALERPPIAVGPVAVSVGASVGVALFEAADTPDDVVTRADRDMFRNKRERKVAREA